MVKADPKLNQNAADEGATSLSPEPAPDPFAGDLFASSRAAAPAAAGAGQFSASDAAATSTAYDRNWHARLPRVSPEQARLSKALTGLAPAFSESVGEGAGRALARYLRVDPGRVSITSLDVREQEFDSARASAEAGSRLWATVSVAPDDERIAVALDADFAAAIVERALGGEGARPDTLREMSQTEQAVAEFLWLSLLLELNARAGAALWRLESLQTRPPSWLGGPRDGDGEGGAAAGDGRAGASQRLMVVSARVEAGVLAGLPHFYLTRRALDALDAGRNPFLRGVSRHDAGAARLERLRRLVPDLPMRPVVGEADVSAAALAELETGDVVVVSRPGVRFGAGGAASGRLGVRLGDGRGVVLAGAVETSAETGAAALAVETILHGGRAPAAEHLLMTEETRDEAEDEGALALGELWLTLNVELAARRISLDELSRLRAGQLLELGCRATDPVELVVDGRTVARGELVDLEGQLGVRITQLTG